MLQQEEADDYVIATGRMETVRRFIEICAKNLNWNKQKNSEGIIWEGEGLMEIGRRADNNEIVIRIDQRYFRPTEVDELRGDPKKSFLKLGWKPETTLEEMIQEMIEEDSEKAMKESYLLKKGFTIPNSFD